MVSLDDVVIARLHKGEDHFEILVDSHETERLIDGKKIDIVSTLAIDAIFSSISP